MAKKQKQKHLYPSQMMEKLLVRFPEGMKDQLVQSAKNAGRSTNSQIIHLLTIGLENESSPDLSPAPSRTDDTQERLRTMEQAMRTMIGNFDRLVDQTLSSVERVDPAKYDYYHENLDPKDVTEMVQDLKDRLTKNSTDKSNE